MLYFWKDNEIFPENEYKMTHYTASQHTVLNDITETSHKDLLKKGLI